MSFVFRCRNCGKRMRVSEKVVDGNIRFKCVHCGCEGLFKCRRQNKSRIRR